MENASRALIMAASVLIGIVIISAFILMMSNLTSYQESSYSSTLSSQIAEFNNQFTTYARDNIRGSDMISLMNKVVDYNTRYTGTEGYTEMAITIDMNGHNAKLAFDGINRLVTLDEYNQTNIDKIVGKPTSVTGGVTSQDISTRSIRYLENLYGQKYCNQLASEIDTIDSIVKGDDTTDGKITSINEERLLEQQFNTYNVTLKQFLEDALKYYEYVQFKRTYFDCVSRPEFDSQTGRIIKLEFECTGVGV